MDMEDDNNGVLHLVMFPWLAIGHLRPFFQLSKCLAREGHLISFISTPRNLLRLPKIPPDLVSRINLISLQFPKVDNLPEHVESSMDIPHNKEQHLKIAFDLLKSQIATFLENTRPKTDWIVYDYASHWLPQLAADNGISRAYFSLFTAAFMAFLGPPSVLMSGEDGRSTAEDFAVVPKWIPFQSNIVYRVYEMIKNMDSIPGNESGTSDIIRFGIAIDGSDTVLFRTCVEFEPEWFNLVCQLYHKPVIPVGVLPPSLEDEDDEFGSNEEWLKIKDWLDKQKSLVYVALGTEATLCKEEVHELALGLEQCGLPFFWVLRKPPTSAALGDFDMLPDGFQDRVKDRGMVCMKWAPQVKILSHPAVEGFLTHCGWNSVIEGLGFGRVLILLPVMNDQGLNARLLQDKNVGLEIPRNEKDGSFTRDSVAESVSLAVVSKEGQRLRDNAKLVSRLFRDSGENKSNGYIDSLINYMVEKRRCQYKSCPKE
ncbi:UDP-glycosyltransferase 91C1 [Abeliophyllum distichum]|uniref:UDP-glycosyltransferase 91C1 n=1 Tax=Abeliophyllum distichum TaxID=126358 RepID=A0ABD1SU91_9LAMI